MADFELDIKSIQDEESALTLAEIFLDSAFDEKGMRRDFVQTFFTNALNNLENQLASPKTKFYTIFILKQLSTKDKVTLKIFAIFSQHPIYNYLEELALNVDPKKPVSEKGKNLFPSEKQTGNNFIRLLLESLMTWGQRFPNNSKKQPTRFKKTLTRLIDEKVVLPKQFIYYQSNQRKSERVETPQGPKQTPQGPKQAPQYPKQPLSNNGVSSDNISNVPSAPKVKEPKQKIVGDVKFMQNKIQTLLSILEESESLEEIQKQVQSYHLKFEKDLQKLESIQSEMIEHPDEELVKLYFKLYEFFNEEKKLFKEHATRNQYDVYVSGYTIAYEKIFQEKQEPIKPPKMQPSIEKKVSESKVEKVKSNLPPPKPTVQKIKSQKADSNYPSSINEKQNVRKKPSEKEPSQIKQSKVVRESKLNENKNVIENCFSKLENRSKSPHQGFGSIAKSIEKERKTTGIVGSRLKTSNAMTLNRSKFAGASNFSKSAAKLKGIFAAPPNLGIRPKAYQGELVIENEQLERQSERIKKQQGIRRLKASFFKSKYILYEDQTIQIGFKSAAIYEQVDKFTSMLDFELFFGNKTSSIINKFQVAFQGDKQSLIYTNPQVIESTIPSESQVKLELLNVPKSIPFGLICIQGSFEILGDGRSFTAILPNSILQMAVYFQLEESKLATIWGQSPKILKTEQFKLSHYFPPDQLAHFLPKLREKVAYSKFSLQGSTIDYELFCDVVLEQKYEGVLKIIIRPDLNVVLQAALYASDDECVYNFKFYLQSLRMALREIDI